MRLNTAGTSINTSLYVSGLTILNNSTTCLSSLNVSGTTTFSNNVIVSVDQHLRIQGPATNTDTKALSIGGLV